MAPIGETKPRGPIAAMYSSPGPCYQLPGLIGRDKHDPRSVHNRGPAWPLLGRHNQDSNAQSPGPKYMVPPNYFRDGPDGSPHYSLYSRPKDWSLYQTPGAGAYSPDHADPQVFRRPAAYSIKGRHDEMKADSSPGPNVYNPDPMLGKTVRSNKSSAPNPSIKGRSKVGGFHEDLQKTPGPGSYPVTIPETYKTKAPQYSITSRNLMPGDTTQKPGPGAYSPETVKIAKRNGPSFSFGIRHSQYKGEYITEVDCE